MLHIFRQKLSFFCMSVEGGVPRPRRKAFVDALSKLVNKNEEEEDKLNRAVYGAQTFTAETPFKVPRRVRNSCLFEKVLLYTRTGQLPLIHVQVTPATIAAILEHGENCRDAVDVPLFGPPHPEDGPGATMRVIPLQPHPLLFQVAWNLEPKMNTDSKEGVKDLLQAHGIPVPKLEHVRGADERRFMLNDLVERYIMHRNWQWHHDKTA